MRQQIHNIISHISPLDTTEAAHKTDALNWVASGAPLFRIEKDVPNKHLVVYFVVVDDARQKVLLTEHKKSQLWLPTGGHVDIDEDPKETVKRECREELRCEASFLFEEPQFISVSLTSGLCSRHTDVSIWYALKGDSTARYDYDRGEFDSIQWFDFDKLPTERANPDVQRFITKLSERLAQ